MSQSSQVSIYYLEMLQFEQAKLITAAQDMTVVEAKLDEFQFNRYLYQLVGQHWQWHDKLNHSEQQWRNYVERPQLRTWVGYCQGSIAGYFELEFDSDGNTEIKYFGLAPKFIGKGYGGYLLSQAIEKAWQQTSTKRLWVHTCTLDHPKALTNYQARGFKLYKTELDNS
ncbi:GNAT family N-acetyltransferase [Paraferrimonas haliotis]|uniref:N-acetyltransferase n=1 Tax=Paraferrimonas haliotis TaxID=2013866 RepID=A0AA37WX74_9GAMM|nr:GNAT family N-acetyltransferase [Paraferrimonas haliotis]GLS84032.1 N-acetyltransferase [Paraferrimonas haliotis]